MRIDLDARVWTRDGEEVGSVQGAVVDPRTNEVTDIIVNAGTVLGRHILIPRALVPRAELERATRHGDPLRLRLSRAALEELLDYLPANYVPPPPGWVAPAGYGFPYDAYLWPAGSDYTAGFPTEQAGKLAPVGKGAVIFDRNGDEAGVVDDVRLDAESGRLRSAAPGAPGPRGCAASSRGWEGPRSRCLGAGRRWRSPASSSSGSGRATYTSVSARPSSGGAAAAGPRGAPTLPSGLRRAR
jgi:sporulation protein YlmC with PRC-barrel domain